MIDMLNIMMKVCDMDPNAGERWFNAADYNKHAWENQATRAEQSGSHLNQ